MIAASLVAHMNAPVEIAENDDETLQKMKRMVNGVKIELAQYVKDGGKVESFMARSCERVKTEAGIYANYAEELSRVAASFKSGKTSREQALAVWEKRNDVLRSLGLPTIFMPSEIGP